MVVEAEFGTGRGRANEDGRIEKGKTADELDTDRRRVFGRGSTTGRRSSTISMAGTILKDRRNRRPTVDERKSEPDRRVVSARLLTENGATRFQFPRI
ncbi:hypothetical protein C8039_08245 [Halogeometricum sp. wsp3]|nr:hypothetical protein C8039_08245 [Halogeometricum sp. wsp3]